MKSLLVSLVLLLLVAPATAQDPGTLGQTATEQIIQFDIAVVGNAVAVLDQFPGEARVTLEITDRSVDGGNGAGQKHYYTFEVTPLVDDPGWRVRPISQLIMGAGETQRVEVTFEALPTAKLPQYPITINGTARAQYCCGVATNSINVMGQANGLNTVAAVAKNLQIKAKPDDIVAFEVDVTNFALTDRQFDFTVLNNPCGLSIGKTGGLVQALATETFTVSVETPNERPWYASENCAVPIQITAVGGNGAVTVPLSVKVEGGYVDPGWIFTFLWFAIPITLIILFIAWRKRRIEEEILGKPQAPWTIPAEQVYLQELAAKDPRAAYVVRNFLMEDEYRSSLDWYHAYKGATKGQRAKERLVLKQEHKLTGWEKRQQRKLSVPEKKADKFALKLQKKLARKDRKAYRKDLRKWNKVCKKLDAKNENVHEKLHATWEKQTKRAQKKGLEAPPEPVLEAPIYPDEPVRAETPLAEHKWATKAVRYQDRMATKAERLEIKYERNHERKLAKVRAKVQKIARKLDDPDFVNQHPLLNASASK